MMLGCYYYCSSLHE